MATGSVRSTSSPRKVRSATFNGTVRPARGRGSSSQTRCSVAVFGSSLVPIVNSSLSSSTFSKSFPIKYATGETM